mgnify:CR=1 FL=1
MKQMLIRADNDFIEKDFEKSGPDFTILNAGEFVADNHNKEIKSKTSVNVNFTTKE